MTGNRATHFAHKITSSLSLLVTTNGVSVRRHGRQKRLRVESATYGCLLEGFIPSYDGDCHRGAKTLSLQSARG
ncbi:MAG: hypothetical protein E7381_05595 [Clostridiales bacterium]|nr:hypothetical protein [Clostridiales bacterium]